MVLYIHNSAGYIRDLLQIYKIFWIFERIAHLFIKNEQIIRVACPAREGRDLQATARKECGFLQTWDFNSFSLGGTVLWLCHRAEKVQSLNLQNKRRLTKKALLLLRLPEKYSFTLSKLRFFGLRKPKNSSFYPTSLQTWVTHFTFGSPTLTLEKVS